MYISTLCERTNSHGTRDFACDPDLQVPFLNAVAYEGIYSSVTNPSLQKAICHTCKIQLSLYSLQNLR